MITTYLQRIIFTFPPILCIAIIAVWSESKFMNPYPAGSPVNLLVITLMLTTPFSPIMLTAVYR